MAKPYKRVPVSSLSDEAVESLAKSEVKEVEEVKPVEPVKKIDKVRVSIDNLNIRKGPGMEFDRTGNFTGAGIFTLEERKNGYGKLKSGEGWISLEFCEDI